MASLVDHSQNEEMVSPLHVEDAKWEVPEIGPSDFLLNDWKAFRMGTYVDERLVQFVAKREIQSLGSPGIPLLRALDVPFCRRAESSSDHRDRGQISALTSSQSRPSSVPMLARRSSNRSLCHEGSGLASGLSRLAQIASATSRRSSSCNSKTCRLISAIVILSSIALLRAPPRPAPCAP